MITNWLVRILFLIAMFLIAFISTFSPVLIARALNATINADFDDLLEPRIRQKRSLLQEKPQEYAERYPDDLEPIRMGGFVAWLIVLVVLYGLLRDVQVFW